jgi:hypothetical protein
MISGKAVLSKFNIRIKARKFIKKKIPSFSHGFCFIIFQRIQKKSPKRFRITDFLFSKICFFSLHIYLDIVLFNRSENLFCLLGTGQSLTPSFARTPSIPAKRDCFVGGSIP